MENGKRRSKLGLMQEDTSKERLDWGFGPL